MMATIGTSGASWVRRLIAQATLVCVAAALIVGLAAQSAGGAETVPLAAQMPGS